MSFSRAPLKRFNENPGCAPPPGTYDLKSGDPKGAASFEKSQRFRPVKPTDGDLLPPPPPSPCRSLLVSPVRRTMSADGLVEGSVSKRERTGLTFEEKQRKLLEREIRCLVQQRGEQDRRLLVLQEELKKMEAKLLATIREKTSFSANVTTLERQRAELKRVNEFLKNKVSADATKKRINSLTMELMEVRNNLDLKNKELSVLQVDSEGRVRLLTTDLQTANASLSALQDRNKDLEDLHQVTKTQNEELESENTRLHAVIQELRAEVKVLQGYLDAANDQIQDLRLKIQENSQTNSQMDELGQLEIELKRRATELQTTEEELRRKGEALKLEEELRMSKDALQEVETRMERQELELRAAEKLKAETEEQLELSRREIRRQETELLRVQEELKERAQQLEEFSSREEKRRKIQEDGEREVEDLRTELNTLQQANGEERSKRMQLEQELENEKALVDSLTALVDREREEADERLRRLKEEMEEVLGELSAMEEATETHQEVVLRLRQEKEQQLQRLNESEAMQESNNRDLAALKEVHVSAMQALLEANGNLLEKTTHVTSELESTKEALEAERQKQTELQTELEEVGRHLKEALEKTIKEKTSEIDLLKTCTREHQERLQAEERVSEKSRIIQKLRDRLTQSDEDLKAMEEKLTARVERLQQELRLQADDLEEQRTSLRREREELRRQNDELIEAKERKVQMEAALREAEEAMEVERKTSERMKLEVCRLQAELQTTRSDGADEARQESARLQAQLELAQQRRRALEDELEKHRGDKRALRERAEVLAQEKVTLQWEMTEKQRKLEHQLAEAQEQKSPVNELWKNRYEELFAKVKPFQEQLNAFAAERNALLNENGANQEELNKVADAYAHLLGHQNQKQKIKHVVKLKDENIALKQELTKLRCQASRQKSDLEQLKAKLPGAARRRFDPSKAFQHDKENRRGGAAEPLTEGNHAE